MMKLSLIIFGLLALSSVSSATNSYLIIAPNLYKVGYDNHLSVYFPRLSQPVQVNFQLRIQHELIQIQTTYQSNETRNVTLTIPKDFPIGTGQLIITGTGGIQFEEKRDVIIYDNHYLLLVQTSSSTYHPHDIMDIRVVATNENLLPIENDFLNIEIYDAALKLVGEYSHIPIRSGLTETIRFPISEHVNQGVWLVSAVLQNTTSSVQVLVSRPITPLFDLKAYFPRYLLRTDRILRGAIELTDDQNVPCFGRVNISINQLTDETMTNSVFKSRQMEIAGRLEIHDDLLSMYNIDMTKALALQISIVAIELSSGHERILKHRIPIFNHDIMYDIRPLEFRAGIENEFEILARRPDGKPIKMENLLVNIRMIFEENQQEKSLDIKDFYTRGRNDMAFFKIEIPKTCLGLMVTMTPLDQSERIQTYRTQAFPLMPTAHRRGEKLTIELLPSKIAPIHTNVNVPVVSSQISTVGRLSNFYVQLIPSKSMEFIEHLPLSYIIMTNGRITLTGEMTIQPTKECRSTSVRSIQPESSRSPTCLYNGTLPIEITRDMIPYSTLIIYGFHMSLGYHVVESYRFSVAGLFQTNLILNTTTNDDRTRLELSINGVSNSIVGLNIFEYDAVLDSLNNEITKERLLKYLTTYEHVSFGDFQFQSNEQESFDKRTISEIDEKDLIHREEIGYKLRYPVEKMAFGVSTTHQLLPVEGDDIYMTSNMAKLYNPSSSSTTNYRRKYQKISDQYDVTVDNNEYIVATSMPMIMSMNSSNNNNNNNTILWFNQMNKYLSNYSQEIFTLIQSGLTIISDFDSLKYPNEMRTETFSKFSHQTSSNLRDQSRQLLEEYIIQTDSSLLPPAILLDEQSRTTYYQSIYFNQTILNSQGYAKVLLPKLKPYTTWIATAFSLHSKSGLAIAQPIRLPTSQGLFLLANFPKQIRLDEHVLLTFAIHNYFQTNLTNIEIRIRSSKDFDLYNQTKSLDIDQHDFRMNISSMKSYDVSIEQLIVVPKRSGFIQMTLEIQSEFGGDYEIVDFLVRNSNSIQYKFENHLYDLTDEKKSYGPIVENFHSNNVQFSVSGTGLDRLVQSFTFEIDSLIGIDRALVCLYRSLAFRRYLNQTSQTHTHLYKMTFDNITKAFQSLQLYNDYNGSYSFVSDEGTIYSSLYLTSLAFGAMLSPYMTVRDNVTLNRTLDFILSHQNLDGSFDDQSPCYHYRFCSGKFRRESLTAIVLYTLTHDNLLDTMSEMIRNRLTIPLVRAQQYLISRVPDVISDSMIISLFEMAFIQNRSISKNFREKIHQALLKRELISNEKDDSKTLKNLDKQTTFDDRILLHAMTASLYSYFKDYRTSSQICHWIVEQLDQHPMYNTILDAIFLTDAWISNILLFREQYPIEKFDVNVHIQTDIGNRYDLKINSTNLDLTQTIQLNSSVRELTYTIDGYGILGIHIRQQMIVKDQFESNQKLPFQLTQQFQPTQWLNEIQARTCLTYTPFTFEHKLVDNSINRTMIVRIELPSGTRINLRQIGFFLSRNQQLMSFIYDPSMNSLSFYINVPSIMFGKSICFNWCLERLSTVMNWSTIPIHVYDYLQQETRLTHLEKIQFEPQILGYSFVDAVHQARPSLETLFKN